jgi:hypothetical protein
VEEIFLKVLNYLPENSIVVPTSHYGQPYSGIEDDELKQRITFATQTKAQVSILRRWQRSAIRTGNSPLLDVVYLASFAALTNAEFVLSGSVTDDDGALHSIAFRHACFSS